MSPSGAFPEWLLVLACVSTGAVGLAWLATLLLRRQSAALRHFVWLLALCAPLSALALGWIHPRVDIPILPRSSERGTALGVAMEQPTALRHSESPLVDTVDNVAPLHPSAALGSRTRFRLPVKPWTGAWLCGAVVVGLRLLFAHLRLKRLVRDSSSPALPDLLRHLNDAKQDFQFVGKVRLQVGPMAEIPFCQGVLQPIIHFPDSWRRWDEERIKICLSHELAHIVRGDLLTLLAGQFACILCWFNPLVWFAAARLRSEAERSADDLVLSRNVAPAIYAANLVAITEHCQASPLSALSMAFAMARPHRLRTRIDAILDPTLRRRSPKRTTILGVSFLASGTLIAAMTVRLTAAPAAAAEKQDLAKLDSQTADAIWRMADAAIKAGDLQTVDSFLKRGLDANANLDSNSSLLFLAVDEHRFDIVKLLLSKGAEVNLKTSWGDTPLRRACWRGYKDIADTLIQAGAPADELLYASGMGDIVGLEAREKRQPITAKEAKNVLSFAVASGHKNTFDWLWTKLGPMDDQQRDKLLGDLYENAGRWGQTGMLRHLQDLEASPAKFGYRALAGAVGGNYLDAAKYLLEEGVSPKAVPPNRWNLLRDPAGEGNLDMVRLLLDHGADINAGDGRVLTPLSWAAYCGKEDVCLLLLERGADGGIEDDGGINAAWRAAGGEHCPAALEAMLKKGVKITGKDKQGQTILNAMMEFVPPRPGKIAFLSRIYSASEMEAYDAREQRVVELLAAAGADYQGQNGTETPLMSALSSGHFAAARTLVKLGADFATKDFYGNNAAYYLIARGWNGPVPLDLLETFLNRGGDPNGEVHLPGSKPLVDSSLLSLSLAHAATRADLDGLRRATRMLIERGARFPRTADEKAQALLQAAAAGSLPSIQEAVRRGAAVNSIDGEGWDALTVAVALDYDVCADWLLANGADPTTRLGEQRYDVLTLAAEHGRTSLVDALVAKMAKPLKGYVGLSFAIRQGNLRIFEALLKAGADPRSSGETATTSDGRTYRMRDSLPLYLCIDHGQSAMAKNLIDHGADADPLDLEGNRSLACWAVFHHEPLILQALLDHGADPTRKADDGDSALSLAQKSHPDLVPMLEAAIKRAQKEDSDADERDRAFLLHKVESIIIPHVDFHAVRLSDALETLRQEAARLDAAEPDPKQRGVNIFLKRPAPAKPEAATTPSAAGPTASVSPGITEVASGTSQGSMADQLITLSMEQRPLLEVLRAVANQVGMKVKPERYAVSLVPSTEQTERLYTAEFRVAPGVFGASVASSPGDAKDQTGQITRIDARSWLEAKGVTFPVGASATYLPGSQKVIVRNTEENINRLKILFPTLSPTK